MTQTNSLIVLINSMTKAEKKSFMIYALQSKGNKSYLYLFDLINKLHIRDADKLKKEFSKHRSPRSFGTAAKYLYKIVLEIQVSLRQNHDSTFSLYNQLLSVRVLREKSMNMEALNMIVNVIKEAKKIENHFVLLIAQRMELEIYMTLHFNNTTEKALLNKHFQINQSINTIRKINEQTSLYELLKYRMLYKGNARSAKQKQDLNDLVFSEMSIVASSHSETFEIRKMHQLFQANYLIATGDYTSAIHSFYELNKVFENNQNLWAKPPVYYLSVLEGTLESLHSIKNYSGMLYFVDKLRKLKSTSAHFNADVQCVCFQYELFPLLDSGDFKGAEKLLKLYNKLYEKRSMLSLSRQAELLLYAALVYLENNQILQAKKSISQIFFKSKMYVHIPIYRTIRLVNLMIYYEMKDFDLINSEIRSLKRDISDYEKSYKTERMIMTVISKLLFSIRLGNRNELWEKITLQLNTIQQDKFERQVLRIFDFTAWIEAKVRNVPLTYVLKQKYDNAH
jgi:hypothetical protein